MDTSHRNERYLTYYRSLREGQAASARLPEWAPLFDQIADRIVSDLKPKSTLDMGCGAGLLVESLRQRGVAASGWEITAEALAGLPGHLAPFCRVATLTDPLPEAYDLIVCLEILAYLSPQMAETAVENLCRHSRQVLLAVYPGDIPGGIRPNGQPPPYWAALFAQHGLFHDLGFDASFIAPWALLLKADRLPVPQLVERYEKRLWDLGEENRARRALGIEQRDKLIAREHELQRMVQVALENQRLKAELATIHISSSYQLSQALRRFRQSLAPLGTRREHWVHLGLRVVNYWRRRGTLALVRRGYREMSRRGQIALLRVRFRGRLARRGLQVRPVAPVPPVEAHPESVDVIVCVHNALEDVARCLNSVVQHASAPYRLILVDDGSEPATQAFLQEFADSLGFPLIRNEVARGYTYAANQGLRYSDAEYAVLLNSDTIVTPQWLDRIVACHRSDPRIGIVGPLSNTASWQSIPEIFNAEGDWAENRLPAGATPADMGRLLACYSERLYPQVPFLNGFCLSIRRSLIEEIGYLDEDTFGEGYGEENDYCLRARQAGWKLAVADDAYIYHAQSRSYSHDRRKRLSQRSDQALAAKHGQEIISQGVQEVRYNRTLQGIRARSRVFPIRAAKIEAGTARWEGKRVGVLLPLTEPAGGGHVIVQEARAMQAMGVDVHMINLEDHRRVFEASFPESDLPVVYFRGSRPSADLLARYDALIASVYHTVYWFEALSADSPYPVKAYYIQDFEANFFPEGSPEYQAAMGSYTRFPNLVRLTKTEWNRAEVERHTGVDCTVVGPSLDIDLFRPRPRQDPGWPRRPLRVAAMIRPSTPRRQAAMTMEVLRELDRRRGGTVEIVLFGCRQDDPEFHRLRTDFPWRHAGLIARSQLASLLNEVDIFTDFSSFQAMGLTAMEAMACGAAVIVPQKGGADSFARHETNALFADTDSPQACLAVLERLVGDEDLRARLQRQAIADITRHTPEVAAYNILDALFGESPARQA